MPAPSAGAAALHEVVCHYKRLGHAPANLLPDLCEILGQLNPQPSVALRHLAEIRGFRLFVSTTPDRLLDEAINAVRFRGRNIVTSLEYSLNLAEDLPQTDEELKSLGNLSPPVVFHPFGKLSVTPNSFVLTEEDLLEFFYNFQKAEQRLPKLLAALRNRQLLFPRRHMVGLVYSASSSVMCAATDSRKRIRWTTSSVIASRPRRSSSAFFGILRTRRDCPRATPLRSSRRYANGGWNAIRLAGPSQSRFRRRPVHARSSSVMRAKTKRRSSSSGPGLRKRVWKSGSISKQLTIGADWQQKITENLRNCVFFLPVISRNTEVAVSDRFFREEWTQAAERARRSDDSFEFILPIKLDDGPHQKVPRKFDEKNWTHLPGGKVTQEFIAQIKGLVTQRTAERDGH